MYFLPTYTDYMNEESFAKLSEDFISFPKGLFFDSSVSLLKYLFSYSLNDYLNTN